MSIILSGCLSTCVAGCRIEHYVVGTRGDGDAVDDTYTDIFYKRDRNNNADAVPPATQNTYWLDRHFTMSAESANIARCINPRCLIRAIDAAVTYGAVRHMAAYRNTDNRVCARTVLSVAYRNRMVWFEFDGKRGSMLVNM